MIRVKINKSDKGTKRIFIIHPDAGSHHAGELTECIGKLKNISQEHAPDFRLLKLTVFVNSKNLRDFTEKKNEYTELIQSNSDLSDVPVLFVAQPPANNKNIAFEVMALILPASEYNYEYKNTDGNSYCKINIEEDYEIFGVVSGESKKNIQTAINKEKSVYRQSISCFEELKNILVKNNMDFGNIVRQWGYMGGITNYGLRITNETETNNRFFDYPQNDKMENYQMFNMARAEYYKNAIWKNGYPAATGIGANVEGCLIEFIAANDNPNRLIIPLHNPKQYDAHRYSSEKFNNPLNPPLMRRNLDGNSKTSEYKCEADTPKFERGKIVLSGDILDLYVSGTAAIIGEDSIPGDIHEQTKTTLENITKLCSKENLDEHGLHIEGELPRFSGVRAYIKFPKDVQIVEELCKKEFGDVPILCVIADVCREELLVEIEAYLNCTVERI